MSKCVAMVQVPSTLPGMRGYIAVTKEGECVLFMQVSDCGQGAACAVRYIQANGFPISTAAWTHKVSSDVRRRLAANLR